LGLPIKRAGFPSHFTQKFLERFIKGLALLNGVLVGLEGRIIFHWNTKIFGLMVCLDVKRFPKFFKVDLELFYPKLLGSYQIIIFPWL